jgi:hypothetical protein
MDLIRKVDCEDVECVETIQDGVQCRVFDLAVRNFVMSMKGVRS